MDRLLEVINMISTPFHRFINTLSTINMVISHISLAELKDKILSGEDVYCRGLHLSARWNIVSCTGAGKLNFIILPDRDSAEYCAADLYNYVEGDRVFFLPDSAQNLQKSNFRDSASVQRTSAVSAIMEYNGDKDIYVVTYPASIEEGLPEDIVDNSVEKVKIMSFRVGEDYPYKEIGPMLAEHGFERVDFVSAPGQYALRGCLVDIFSYGFNYPYRVSFFGDEVERISVFDANTQLSRESADAVDIVDNVEAKEGESTASLFEILPKNTLLWLDSADLYKDNPFFSSVDTFQKVFIQQPLGIKDTNCIDFNIAPQPVFNKNFELLAADIKRKYLQGYKVYIYADKRQQVERLRSILMENGGMVPEFVCGKTIHQGFIDNYDKICCYSDHEIFDRFHRVSMRRSVDKTEQLTVNDLAAFNIGDYIVHIDLGIGIFGGLVRMKDDKGRWQEVVKLQYRDGDVVFISVHSLHKISKFRSKDGEVPKITRLGSKTWSTLKENTKRKVKDIAKELIQLYAKRKSSRGHSFSYDNYLLEELESSFEWEETPDQIKAIEAIKRDMEDICPMDRLVCGDVGFGKTEVAIRAAFKAVCDSKQVAVLVPTTILCLQHYKTFCRRLENMPCTVDFVSRLRTPKEIKDIQKRLADGQIDIIIGTHKILGAGFNFKDLGLLIIDEEQKFGVSSKEKLRQLKASVDTLTLTATPIPRTLQFSLLGARDLSIINTPPPNRVPVQTEIMLFSKDEIKSIIDYELKRSGQVFFVHNRVEELDAIYDILHRLMPDISICVAHGQMESKILENKILDFMAGEYDLLLCTTIIENGLDIPNANTIIINQAQNIGLSDLHQLRGRVGRSRVKGFCYLIVPPLTSITDDARKRLKAIEAFSDLGSGFNIAMQDLDIRGAGNLLGAEQSGFITDMGMETYQKILAEAMDELGLDSFDEGGAPRNDAFVSECAIETDITALIPEDYVNVQVEKIRIYKELDSASDDKSLMRVRANIEDRFGPVPPELDALFEVVRIRSLGRRLGFEKVIIKNGILICFFISNPMSPYFRSKRFAELVERLNSCGGIFEMKQKDNSLKLISRNVNSLQKAYKLLTSLL